MRWHYLDGEADAPGPDDRGFAYGDGLFETIAVRDGRPRLLERHLERLRLGADRLSLRLPARRRIEEFIARIVDGVPAADRGRAVLKLVATRGDGERGYAYRHSDARLLAGIGPARDRSEERREARPATGRKSAGRPASPCAGAAPASAAIPRWPA